MKNSALTGLQRYLGWLVPSQYCYGQPKKVAKTKFSRLTETAAQNLRLACLGALWSLAIGQAIAQTTPDIQRSVTASDAPLPVFRDKFADGTEGPEMVVIPAGEFLMGSPAGEGQYVDEAPQHTVKLKSFALGQTEVTQKQWRQVMGGDPPELYFKGCDDCPVESVSWNDIQKFLKKLNGKTGKRYRLPSESEWEYAARAGTTTAFGTGNTITAEQANFDAGQGNGRGEPVLVGSFKPNAFGLYDMHGNVWEWVEDCWHSDYTGAPQNGRAWVGRCTEDNRVLRGGSWISLAEYLRSAVRSRSPLFNRHRGFGFRVARTLP